MKMKKVLALVLAGIMTFSLAACGNTDAPASNGGNAEGGEAAGGKLVVWTLAADLEQFSERFIEKHPGVEIETVVIAPEDYPTKVETAILGGASEPDIIVGEPQMLQPMYEAGMFASLDDFGAKDYQDKIVDYVWDVGTDADGVTRAISYQITPAGFFYRRDIAQKVFGTDDPVEIGKLFADYATILETGKTLKDAGYRIFASDAELNYSSGDSAWVIDGKLNVDQARFDYMDMCVELYKQDMTAYAAQWAAPWYQAMSGPVPILTAETQWGTDDMNVWDAENFEAATEGMETTEVFAFGLPAWGTLVLRDHVGETSGLWGVCSGPAYGFGGGTFIGISDLSKNKDLAWEYVRFCTLDEETADWWIEKSEGDTVSLISALEKHADDENPVYGNQKLYKFWMEQAQGIDYSKVTQYDKAIGDAWGVAITAIKTGEMTKEAALEEFYNSVAATYPELEIDR